MNVQDSSSRSVLQLRDVHRVFRQGDREIRVLNGANADLYPGQAVALVGPSGAGKSTLLHIAGLLETADAGRVFISGKDGKLYVRQNFKPVFDMPVTIAPSDKLLGTHVFTAEVDKTDANALRWSVVSIPVTARNAQRIDADERATRRRKVAGSVPPAVKPAAPMPNANGPAEALDRITVPPDVMAKIGEALATGGSIVVSDQSIKQGETGEGTDFIVRLR